MFHPVATEVDIRRVAELASEIWREHYPPIIGHEQVGYMLERFQSPAAIRDQIRGGRIYALMDTPERPAGYLAYDRGPEEVFLSKLYVGADRRREGWARRALRWIDEREGFRPVRLTVNRANADTLAAYRRLGFEIVDTLRADIGHGFVMDDYVLLRPPADG